MTWRSVKPTPPMHSSSSFTDTAGGMAEVGRDQHEVAVGVGRIERAGHPDAGERGRAGGVDARVPDREAVRLGDAAPGGVGGAGMAEQGPQAAVGGDVGGGEGCGGRGPWRSAGRRRNRR